VGSGPCWSDVEARARELGILTDCVFQPATLNVAQWLEAIDIFVLPSFSEALSNSLMEAMACGCAVVATRVGGNPELVVHGETGMLFDVRDTTGLAGHLRHLSSLPDLRALLAANAARFIRQRFSLETSAKRMGEIYSEWLA
jgi:glycosyltransferase involved in cell wall biosynthesis